MVSTASSNCPSSAISMVVRMEFISVLRTVLNTSFFLIPEASWARCTEVNRPRTISCIRS